MCTGLRRHSSQVKIVNKLYKRYQVLFVFFLKRFRNRRESLKLLCVTLTATRNVYFRDATSLTATVGGEAAIKI